MKEFLKTIPNKTRSIYLLWVTFHFCLLLLSGNVFRYHYLFWPYAFNNSGWKLFELGLSYDYSEFFIYTFVPIVLYYAYYLYKKDENKSKKDLNN
jgi:hypothetical protein